MIDSYRKLYDILSRAERRKLYLLVAMMLVNGILEMTGVAAILPFLAVLADPGIIETNAYSRGPTACSASPITARSSWPSAASSSSS
jgi:hypothetical protein